MHTKKSTLALIASLAMLLILPTTIRAQVAQPAGPENAPEAVEAPDNFPNQNDDDVRAFVSAMTGMHRGDDHTLYINTVKLPDSAPALYVELVIAGEENQPVRQQVWVPHRRDGELRVRVCELPLGMQDLVVGMWAAPSLYPAARLEQYASLGDLKVTKKGGNYSVQSAAAMPISRDGAIDYEFRFEITGEGVRWIDSGRSINNDVIFGLDLAMKKRPNMPEAKKLDGGVLIYDLREGFAGAKLAETDSIAFFFSEWSLEGFLIDSTDRPHRVAQVFTVPDERDKALRSWDVGLIGIRQGGIRRVYDPAAQFGILNGEAKPFQGQPMPLISEVTVVSIKDNTP